MHFFTHHIHWVVRIVIAAIFIYHGLGKFPPEGFAQAFNLSTTMGYLVAFGEVLIGITVFFGGLGLSWLTRLGGLLMVIIMVGAVVLAKWGKPFPAMEEELLLIALGLFFLVRGNHGVN